MTKIIHDKKKRITAVIALVIVSILAVGISAYFSDLRRKKNTFTPGDNKTDIHETVDYPDVLSSDPYLKKVTVKNDSNVSCYIRTYVGFSEASALKKTGFSNESSVNNSTVFYPADPAKTNSYAEWIKSGWSYNSSTDVYTYDESAETNNNWFYCKDDGYYYYTLPVASGEETLPLFTYVETNYGEDEAQSYDIIVYSESVQIYGKNGVEVQNEIKNDSIKQPMFIRAFYVS